MEAIAPWALLAGALGLAGGWLLRGRRAGDLDGARRTWTALRAAQMAEFLSYALFQLREYLTSLNTAAEALALSVPPENAELTERAARLKRLAGELNAKAARLLGERSGPATQGALTRSSFDLGELVRRTAARARNAFGAAPGVEVVCEGALEPVRADRRLLEHCLLAVLQNSLEACAASGRGPVSVIARQSGGAAEIEVIDDGGGIAAPDQAGLFEPLHSAGGGGLGLGLSMSRRIIERMGGSLRVKSQGGATAVLLQVPMDKNLPVVRNEESTWAARRHKA